MLARQRAENSAGRMRVRPATGSSYRQPRYRQASGLAQTKRWIAGQSRPSRYGSASRGPAGSGRPSLPHPQRLVIRPGEHAPAVRRPRAGQHPVLVPLQAAQAAAAFGLPHPQRLVIRPGEHAPAVRRPRDGVDRPRCPSRIAASSAFGNVVGRFSGASASVHKANAPSRSKPSPSFAPRRSLRIHSASCHRAPAPAGPGPRTRATLFR